METSVIILKYKQERQCTYNVTMSCVRATIVAVKKLQVLHILCVCVCVCVVLLTQYCAGGKIEKNEMGGACGAYGGGERCAQGSDWET